MNVSGTRGMLVTPHVVVCEGMAEDKCEDIETSASMSYKCNLMVK